MCVPAERDTQTHTHVAQSIAASTNDLISSCYQSRKS